ncbi:MAG: beta-ketoacyl-ACP synthase III [Rhodocyclaceae bacterium]|nr:beta-ketoacyl-ACP synthase III [Rhodocyclaceae bacterium]
MSAEVFITRTAGYLPFDPVPNERMEDLLGRIGGKSSRARRLVLRSNGIQTRHYAIDPASGEITMSNAQLAAAAIRALGADIGPVDCLAVATTIADQIAPGHGVMVHGELGWPQLEVVSLAGICLSGTAALRYAMLTVAAGGARSAVACASELSSQVMRAGHFDTEAEHRVTALEQRPELAFDKEFLRWMLSDGAGAVLLQGEPGAGPALRMRWIELFSNAQQLPTCMYAGAERDDDGRLTGWARTTPSAWGERSVFALKQDVRLLNAHIAPVTLTGPLAALRERHGLSPDQVDWFLPHISSMYFWPILRDTLAELDFAIPESRWFTNLARCGNTGSASPYLMLDELMRSGRVRPGQRLLMYIPESGRFSSGFVYLEAV